MTTQSLDTLIAFQAVAESRSFTRAAERLGSDKSRISRTVRSLEMSLGVALLVRSTRMVALTPEGDTLFQTVSPLLAALQEAISTVPNRQSVPAGEVAITTTPDLGRALLAPALVSFRLRYPAVRVRVVLAAEVVDLMGQGVDLALRIGRPGGDGFIARKLMELEAGFFASPAYLARNTAPTSMEALALQDGLWPEPKKGNRSFAPQVMPPKAAIQCADFSMIAELARMGAGVALLPTFLASADLTTGALVRVLPKVSFSDAPLYLVSRPLRPLPSRVAALRDWLIAHVRVLGRT